VVVLQALHDVFLAFGNIPSCKVATDELGCSKDYGLVHYGTVEGPTTKPGGGVSLEDKRVCVGHHGSGRSVDLPISAGSELLIRLFNQEHMARIDEKKGQLSNGYIKNLDTRVSEKLKILAQFGPTTSTVLQIDAEGRTKGPVFVHIEKHLDSSKPVEILYDSGHGGGGLSSSGG